MKQIAMLVHDIQDENYKRRAQTDTLQTKTDALQSKSDDLSKRMDTIQGENARLRAQVRTLAGRIMNTRADAPHNVASNSSSPPGTPGSARTVGNQVGPTQATRAEP